MNKKIIFCGDLVCPYNCSINYEQIKSIFQNATVIANLEGAILSNQERVQYYKWNDKFSLYSSPAIFTILRDLNIRFLSLCNNHILDYQQPIEETLQFLSSKNIQWWGLKNHDIVHTTLNNKNVHIITFATFSNEHSLKLFNPHKVILDIKNLRENDPSSLIVVYPHWGIEKFYYPEPADRELAHACVDAGANLIIGHHPHIIQPIEIYKGVNIIYSIGNFILPQTYYGKKKLTYKQPEIKNELVVEWDGENIKLHTLYYDTDKNALRTNNDYDITSLYQLFKDKLNYNQYLHLYIHNTSWLNLLFRTRYFANKENEYINYFSRNLFRYLRKICIVLRIHKPYKI